jgi:hypothetical protein
MDPNTSSGEDDAARREEAVGDQAGPRTLLT